MYFFIYNKNMQIFGNNYKNLRFIGRCIESREFKNATLFAFSCTGFEFVCEFKNEPKLVFSFYSNINPDHEFQYGKIFIDDEYYKTIKISKDLVNVDVDFSNIKGKHLINFIKINEASICDLTLLHINFENITLHSFNKAKKPLIMFFGDSLTCGYGILGNPTIKKFNTNEEDSSITYAYLSSFKLGFECSMVACSGISLSRVFCPYGVTMLDQYDTVNGKIKYDKSEFPAFAIINLSSNDYAVLAESTLPIEKIKENLNIFVENYIELFNYILNKNESCKIISCYNIGVEISDNLIEAIKLATFKINELMKKEVAYVLDFTPDQNGANGHPCKKAHEVDAIKLENFIKGIRNDI